jgi:hypothetical protein
MTEQEQRRLIHTAWRIAPERLHYVLLSMHLMLPTHPQLVLIRQQTAADPELAEAWAELCAKLMQSPVSKTVRQSCHAALRELVATDRSRYEPMLVGALVQSLDRVGFRDFLDMKRELRDLAKARLDDLEIQRSYAIGLVKELSVLLRFQEEHEVGGFEVDVSRVFNQAFVELESIAKRFPEDWDIQYSLAAGLINLQIYYGVQDKVRPQKITSVERDLEALAARFPDQPQIQLRLSSCQMTPTSKEPLRAVRRLVFSSGPQGSVPRRWPRR